MKRAGRLASALVGGCMAVVTLSAGGLVIASVATASQPMVPTTWVNMRSGPSTKNPVVAVLSPSQTVTAGTLSGGWYQVTTDKGVTGWVYQSYLKAVGPASPPPANQAPPTASGSATTTAGVNVRTGPSTSYPSLGIVPKGTTLPTTGKTSGGWTEVIHGGQARWISSSYLTTGKPSTSKPVGQVRTTANLYLRSAGNATAPHSGVLPGNSVVDTTGNTTADYTEIIHRGQNRWIATRFTTAVSNAPAPAPTPVATSTVYVNVGSLYVRATSAADGPIVGTVYRGAALETTGAVSGDRLQVIHLGAPRWVYKPYTTTANPSTPPPKAPLSSKVSLPGYDRLNANAKAVVQHTLDNYPLIRTIGGYRPSSSYSSDHPNGRAVDIMVSNWSQQSSIDYGWAIARDFQANAAKYNITYIIWRQQIWNASYPGRGWRPMENRGGPTANHYDHIHISVRP